MKMHQSNISIIKRLSAVFMSCCLFSTSIVTVHGNANKAFAEDTQNTFMIDQKRTLAYAGGRSYTMTIDADSYFSNEYSPSSTNQSEDNYYTAPYDGKYLVQLWGGDGGDGNQYEEYSGKGGAGGYVWSIVELEKGDVLLYNIGTKGTSTVRENSGGGQNGDGGAHGDDGSMSVGGGGGYSAVYYYPEGTFDGSLRPSEADRMSKFIMIAGGGGGGGGFGADATYFHTGSPTGGDGGKMGSSASGSISDSAVPGTYFAGSDGKSSGTSLAYVGKGGTYKPGAAVKSGPTYILLRGNVYSYSTAGNDWFRISDSDTDGGSGGAGNLNGGAGGAGYCGGSGGVMEGYVNYTNISGGGGGSSFLANAEYMTNDLSKLSDSEHEIYEKSLSEKSNKAQGGYCNIAYLSSEQTDCSLYENVSFTVPVSDYFNVSAETNGNGTWNSKDNTITGVDISPDEHGRENNHADITLTFTAKDTFPGGNNVPLLNGKIGMSATGVTLPSFDADDELDYVNVPLAYKLDTFSFWHDKYTETDTPVAADDLYSMNCTADSTDAYGNVISAVTMDPALTAPYNKPQATQTFDISYTVTPNEENKAKVGPVQHERTYSGTAVVNIKEEDTTYVPDSEHSATDDLNGSNSDITIKTSRSLDYTGSSYQTVITVNASSKKVPYNIIENYSLASTPLTMSGNNITIPEDGWYLLESWGGDGGDGQAADGANDASGGKGGNGGYVYGFKEFHKNDMLECTTGASGTVPGNSSPTKNATNKIIKGAHGNGGGYSAIKYGDKYLIIAGGGGAGGGGISTSNYLDFIDGGSGNGGDGQENNEISSQLEKEMNAYSGKAATDADYHASTGWLDPASISAPSKGGAAGENYRASDVYSEFSYNSSIGTSGTADPSGAGLVKVTRIIKETSVDEQDRTNKEDAAKAILENISFDLSGTWSPYFGGGEINQTNLRFNTPINTTEDTTKHTFTANASLEITISANPVNGFLGGNDVPLFSSGGLELNYTYHSITSENIPLKDSDSLNYVNVAVAEPVFTAKDAEKFYGEDFSVHDDLIKSDFSVDTDSILDDFVEYELNASPSGSDDPNIGTAKASQKYTLTASLTPDAAGKATVIPPVSAVQYSQEAELTVNYKVETELTNITCDADEKLPMDEDLSTTLKADEGYELPSAITVKCGDTVLSPIYGYRYSKDSGELFIPNANIDDNITIIAEAVIPTYDLVFRYYTDADNSMLMEKSFSYPAGTVFDANSTWHSFYDSFAPEEIEGMTFQWNWGETGEESITEMPAQNWFVTGKYILNQYDLTIHYQDADGNTLEDADGNTLEDYKQTLLYGDEYNVASPAVANHIPQTAVVSGTIEDNTEITVIYEKIVGKLVVVYLDEDGKTISPNYETDVDAGGSYNAVSPTVAGYTPDIAAVSGTMPSEGGVYQTVTYHPNTYTLTFNADGGSLSTADSADRTVYYGKEIGWCGKDTDGKYTFEALPVPIKEGSTFLGWKLNGEIVKEDTVFTLTENATLTAEWEADTVTLKVYYFFEDGTEAAEAVSYTETPSGTELTNGVIFPLKDVAEGIRTNNIANGEHYTTQCDATVTMGFVDKAVNVIFVANEYTLTVKYKDENGEISGVTDSYDEKYGTEYQHDARTPESVDATKYDNHYASPSVIEGTMDGDTTVYVSFVRKDTVISVSVDWSSLVFDAQNVTWDPEQHIYYADSYLTEDTKKEYGTITVTNGSTNSTPIRASLSYDAKFGYENMLAEYTDEDDNDISSVVVPADESAEIRVTPKNRITFAEPGGYTIGTCTVRLTAGE